MDSDAEALLFLSELQSYLRAEILDSEGLGLNGNWERRVCVCVNIKNAGSYKFFQCSCFKFITSVESMALTNVSLIFVFMGSHLATGPHRGRHHSESEASDTWVASWFWHIAFPRTMASIGIQQWLEKQRGIPSMTRLGDSLKFPKSWSTAFPNWRLWRFPRIGLNITFPHIRCDEVDGRCSLIVAAGVNFSLETEGCCFINSKTVLVWILQCGAMTRMGECGDPWTGLISLTCVRPLKQFELKTLTASLMSPKPEAPHGTTWRWQEYYRIYVFFEMSSEPLSFELLFFWSKR